MVSLSNMKRSPQQPDTVPAMDGPVVYAAKRRCCLKMAKSSHERQRLFSGLFGKPNRVHEKTALKVLFFMNSEHNKLAQNILHSLLWQDIFPESINGVVIWRTLTLK